MLNTSNNNTQALVDNNTSNNNVSMTYWVKESANLLCPDYYQKAKEIATLECDGDIFCLYRILKDVELPEYRENVFDCSEVASYLDWLLEGGYGFKTYLATSGNFCLKSSGEYNCFSHMWVLVELRTGEEVAIEPTSLCRGENYDPPGIIERPDGGFREYTSLYRAYTRYPVYESFEEFIANNLVNYTISDLENESRQYYLVGEVFDSPLNLTDEKEMPLSEFDWWNTSELEPLLRDCAPTNEKN